MKDIGFDQIGHGHSTGKPQVRLKKFKTVLYYRAVQKVMVKCFKKYLFKFPYFFQNIHMKIKIFVPNLHTLFQSMQFPQLYYMLAIVPTTL